MNGMLVVLFLVAGSPLPDAARYTHNTDRAGFGAAANTDEIGELEGEIQTLVIVEEVPMGKREVESGGEQVSTRVEETPVQEQVTLRDEHIAGA